MSDSEAVLEEKDTSAVVTAEDQANLTSEEETSSDNVRTGRKKNSFLQEKDSSAVMTAEDQASQSSEEETSSDGVRTLRKKNSILSVRTQHESISPEHMARLSEASRQRRSQRLLKVEGPKADTVVRFSTLSIREYGMVLSDNPGDEATQGSPVGIDWKHFSEATISVDAFESTHPPRRCSSQLRMPSVVRLRMLRAAGYSLADVRKLTKPVNIARARRRRSLEMSEFMAVHELSESFRRSTLNVLTLGSRKRRERKFLDPYIDLVDEKNRKSVVSNADTNPISDSESV